MMTRKDFELIAGVMYDCRPEGPASAFGVWHRIVLEFAKELKSTNPYFDRERFISACLREE